MLTAHLSLHQLELFCAVVEYGGVGEAARRLYLSQPSLSQQLKALERAIGTALWERRGGRLRLTEAGRATYEYARNLLAMERQLKVAVADLVTAEYGALALGTSRPFGRNFIPEVVADFVTSYEHVEVSVVYRDTETLFQEVLNRTLDIGVVTGDSSTAIPSGLEATALRHDHWTLVSRPGMQWIGGDLHQLFAQAPLITGVNHSTHWRLIQKLLNDLGLLPGEFTVRLRMEDLDAIKASVSRGLGIAFLPYSLVQNDIQEGRLLALPLPLDDPPLHCLVVHVVRDRLRPTVLRFLDFLLARVPTASS